VKILMLAQFFNPIIGGEERAVEDLSGALAARGHEVVVATLKLPGTPPEEENGGVRVRRLEGLVNRAGVLFSENERRHLPPFADPLLARELARVVAEERPDVVHAHNWIVHSFIPVRRRTSAPLILSLHDYSLVCAQKRMIRSGAVCSGPAPVKCLRCAAAHYGMPKGTVIAGGLRATARRLAKQVDLYLPVSSAVAERLELDRRGLRYEIVPNLVPGTNGASSPSHDPELVGLLPTGEFVLFLGDATEDKGARVLQEAYGQLQDPPPLVVIGRPVDIDPVSAPPNVMPLGPWPHSAALEAVSRCAMLVAPSIVPETFGISALEAMARGKPVVASRSGGYADLVVDGETGRLVPPGDPAALRNAIAGLLSDAGAREAMGRAARERAGLYSVDVVAPRVEEIYLTLCEERSGRSGRAAR
jgi:glycosyltransferase involved in cell wall biosynthesis